MSRISQAFEKLKQQDRKAFIPYLTCGYPSLEETEKLVVEFDAAGATLVELGVPFSDPIADGPTIQKASQRALAGGTTLRKILRMVERVRMKSQLPAMIFSYFNPVHKYGLAAFMNDARAAGVDGVLLPDVVPEEADDVLAQARRTGLDVTFLIAPTSSPERMRMVGEKSTAFVYAVSLTGVTGERTELPAELGQFLALARRHIHKPLVVGFGIGTPEQARAVARLADGVVAGSAIVRSIERHENEIDLAECVGRTVRELARAVNDPRP